MSTNCIRCVVNQRTGGDLLCDPCRAQERIERAAAAKRCPIASCGITIDPTHLLCSKHWAMLPRESQNVLIDLRRDKEGTQEHRASMGRAVTLVAEKVFKERRTS